MTLEPVPFSGAYQLSPDGREIVYVALPGEEVPQSFELKVIPSNGGNVRTVWQQAEGLRTPVWPGDGYLYFLSHIAPPDDDAVFQGIEIRRVRTEGGVAETVSAWPTRGQLSADAKHYLYRTSPRTSEEAIYELASTDGRRLASFVLPENMTIATCFTTGGLGCLATTEDLAAPLKVIPVQGGPTRQLTETRSQEWPLGWTADGSEVVFQSEIDGTKVIMAAPLTGAPTREVYRLPQEDWVYGPSLLGERYLPFGKETGSEKDVTLQLLDIQTGSEREITRTPWTSYTYYNSSTDGERFLYAERKEGRFEFRAVSPGGGSELLRAFPDDGFPPVWSPGGRYLATGHWRPETNQLDALVVQFDSFGELVADPLVVDNLPDSWWNLTWLPSSDAFLVVSGDLWLVSLDPDAPLVKLTDEQSGPTWPYALSPDGRYVAVTPEVRRGGSIWRLDLGEALRTVTGR